MKVSRATFALLLLSLLTARAGIHPTYSIAVMYLEQQQYGNALVAFNELFQQFPEQKESYFNRGLCLYKSGKYAEALLDVDESLRLDSCLTDAALLKALCYEKTGRFEEAENVLNELVKNADMPANLQQRIQNYRLTNVIASKWYYMVIMAFIVIVVIALLVSFTTSRKV